MPVSESQPPPDKAVNGKLTVFEKALIFEVQRFSTEDGPGIRTTVFFKGCPLACDWCHNPESISGRPEMHWLESRCIGCHTCLEVCPRQALHFTADGLSIHRDRCDLCGLCTRECPSTALEQIGKTWTLSDLVDEVLKDKAYYQTSGGGVTVSGGEPTRQAEFTAEFLKRLQEQGVHTTLDTCGLCRTQSLEMILPWTDLVLFDLKLIDARAHKAFTGSDNRLVLDNLTGLVDYMEKHHRPKHLWIRTPVIPGATDSRENINAIGRHIAAVGGKNVSRWDLCAFNNLCQDKYRRLGRTWKYAGRPCLTSRKMEELAAEARASGVDPAIVQWSGTTSADSEIDSKQQEKSATG